MDRRLALFFHRFATPVSILALAATVAGQSYQVVWQDEFDGTALDLAKWETQIGTGCPNLCGWGNNELQYYRAENATVAGGFLTIAAKQQSFGGRAYTSARLRTKYLGDWKYGRFEMRAKLPIGQGIWPAFWMLPTDSPYGGWPTSGEIDILEYLGQNPDEIFGTIHYGGPAPIFASTLYKLPGGDFSADFHRYGIEWEPNEIRWYLDGVQFACKSNWSSAGGSYPAPFDQQFHLLLNMAVGGNLPGDPDGSTQFPQALVVDWVRVSQKATPDPPTSILFDGMDHANPFANNYFVFNGVGGGGIGANTTDLPPEEECSASLESGWGGPAGFIGGFGRNNPLDLTRMTHFEFWLNPDAGQTYTLQINLQEDDNGDNAIPGSPNGADDEWQHNLAVSPTGPGAISGGGWQKISIPLADFFDDGTFHWGGNGIFDPFSVGSGGNGQLINLVIAIISPTGGSQTFRTDHWNFVQRSITAAPDARSATGSRLLGPAFPNPFGVMTELQFELRRDGFYSLEVFDLRGQRVRELRSGWGGPGPDRIRWDGRTASGAPAASGVYFVRLRQGKISELRKVVLQR